MSEQDDDKHTAVDKALVLLKLLGDCSAKGEVRLSDLVKESGYQRPTVHRLLATLKRHGFVDQEQEGGGYRLGGKVMALGAQAYGALDIRRIARPVMLELSRRTLLTVHLAIVEQFEVVYVEKIDGALPIRLASGVGWRGALHCTALGKAMTAFAGQELRHRALQAGLASRTQRTIVDPDEFDSELRRILTHGYAVDDEENEPEVRCVGAPILNDAGRAVAGMSVSGTISQVTEQRVTSLGESVRAACLTISEQIGYRPRQPGSA
jgi:DNA-binding IclR family transcriptional regulator